LTTAISPFKVGEKVKFTSEKRRYTVRAAGARFAVLNKPFNPKNTVLYTVVDLEEGVRGTENLVFGAGAETDEHCVEMLKRLESGQTEVSHRNRVNIDIESREEG
jgi:hypothetical protein